MSKIETFVFFDIETTGLPYMERNRTKITDFCFLAAIREDILGTELGKSPLLHKLCFVVNPEKEVSPGSEQLTGLTFKLLKNEPKFKQRISSIIAFLDGLPKPICLVAHNGNVFDYKILLAEFVAANASLPDDLMCVDSLVGFRKILKGTDIKYSVLVSIEAEKNNISVIKETLLTDDEDDFPELNISAQEWDDIDDLCSSFSDISTDGDNEIKNLKREVTKNVFSKKSVNKTNRSLKATDSYKLVDLYERLLDKVVTNAHRAEADCIMLGECVVALKNDFLPWADQNCKPLSEIKPLLPY